MERMETVDTRTWKERYEDAKGRVGIWWNDTKNFVKENKQFVLAMTAITGQCLVTLVRSHAKHVERKEEKELKNCYVYDSRTRHYNHTRRPLTSLEWREYDERFRNGEDGSQILRDMRLSK